MCIGYLCFVILFVGSFFQIYDIYKMFLFILRSSSDYKDEKRDNLRHILTIGHFFVGITLNIFGLAMMQVNINL